MTELVDAYLEKVPEPGRTTLTKLRASIRKMVPAEATEAISYGMPAFKYKGGLVCYAAFKDHCSLFPPGTAHLTEIAEEIAPYKTSKGTLRFALDKPLPTPLLKKSIKACIADNEAKEKPSATIPSRGTPVAARETTRTTPAPPGQPAP